MHRSMKVRSNYLGWRKMDLISCIQNILIVLQQTFMIYSQLQFIQIELKDVVFPFITLLAQVSI